jgi:hypothetical protein
MTLHNNARHLREAATSLLAQTRTDFVLLMLDDASTDATEAIAREYERHDPRVRYFRHELRQGMVRTWREVAELSWREYPSAEYFAWTSDHDRWEPDWLARLAQELESHQNVVLAYPLCSWIDDEGEPVAKRPRQFATRGLAVLRERWSHFCHDVVGAGDMVYGLMRIPALRAAGVFRVVLRPDRLLMAQMTLQGEISQTQEILWIRRQTGTGSVTRQGRTLVATRRPWWFWLPPWTQHAFVLLREHGAPNASPRIPLATLLWMVVLYQATYTWRHVKRAGLAQGMESFVSGCQSVRKNVRRTYGESLVWARLAGRHAAGRLRWQTRRARHELPLATRAMSARVRRACRHRVRDARVLTRRLGLRGNSSPRE